MPSAQANDMDSQQATPQAMARVPGPPVSADPGSGARGEAEAVHVLPRVEGYRLVEPLGSGGMGTVWRAVQLSSHRVVALKMLRGSSFGSARARARFEREIELLSKLEHPHIARLYHSGVHHGLQFYAMELVDGVPLDAFVERNGLGRDAVLRLMATVCRAIDYAHRRGVIHRDIKPSNIFVDETGEPRVLDFGLGKDLQRGEGPELSVEGAAAGTLLYMSPEQAAGDHARVDTRTDVYSLGVLLYRLLTGRHPHDEALTPYLLQRAIVEEEPPRPRAVSPGIDSELEAILLKALAKVPEQRYSSPGELAEDLLSYGRGDPVRARKLTLAYLLRKRLARYRGRVAAAVLALSLVAGGVTYSSFEVDRARRVAQRHAEDASRALYHSQIRAAHAAMQSRHPAQARQALLACDESLRGWEWHHLSAALDMRVRHVPVAGLQTATLSADGREVVCVDWGNRVEAWDIGTGDKTRSWTLGDERAFATFSGDGRFLVSARDTAVSVWSLDTLEPAYEWTLPPELAVPEAAVPVSWSAKQIGFVSRSGRLVRLQVGDPTPRTLDIEPFGDQAVPVAVADDGTVATVTATDNNVIQLIDADGSGRRSARMQGLVQSLVFRPDGLELAALSGETIALLDVRTLASVDQRTAGAVRHAAYTADGTKLVYATPGGIVAWSPRSHAAPSNYLAERERRAVVHRSGFLLGVAEDGVDVWDRSTPVTALRLPGQSGPIRTLSDWRSGGWAAVSLHGSILAGRDGRMVEVGRLAERPVSVRTGGAVGAAGVIALRSDGVLAAWDPLRGVTASNLGMKPDPSAVGEALLCGDGRWLVVADGPRKIALKNLSTGEGPRTLEASFPAGLSANGRLVAVDPRSQNEAVLWSLSDARVLRRFRAESGINRLSVSADGGVVGAGTGTSIVIWDTASGDERSRIDAGKAVAFALSPDGSRLVLGQDLLPIVDTHTGEKLLDLSDERLDGVGHVAFSRDGAQVAAMAGRTLMVYERKSIASMLTAGAVR